MRHLLLRGLEYDPGWDFSAVLMPPVLLLRGRDALVLLRGCEGVLLRGRTVSAK